MGSFSLEILQNRNPQKTKKVIFQSLIGNQRLTEKTCIFSLSERDEAFAHKDMKRAKTWLTSKDNEEPYYFAEKSPRGLSPDSKVLFSFDAQIFGQAVAKENVRNIPFEEQEARRKAGRPVYKHSVVFKRGSVEIFHYNPTKTEITEKLGIQFSQVFTYVTQGQYDEIVRMARGQRSSHDS